MGNPQTGLNIPWANSKTFENTLSQLEFWPTGIYENLYTKYERRQHISKLLEQKHIQATQ